MFIYYVGRKSDLASMGRANCKVKDEGMSITGELLGAHLHGANRQIAVLYLKLAWQVLWDQN